MPVQNASLLNKLLPLADKNNQTEKPPQMRKSIFQPPQTSQQASQPDSNEHSACTTLLYTIAQETSSILLYTQLFTRFVLI